MFFQRCIDSAMGPPVDDPKKNARGKTLLKEKKVELKVIPLFYQHFTFQYFLGNLQK